MLINISYIFLIEKKQILFRIITPSFMNRFKFW